MSGVVFEQFFFDPLYAVSQRVAGLRQTLQRMRSDRPAPAPAMALEYRAEFFLGARGRQAVDWGQGQPLDRMLFAVNDNGHASAGAFAPTIENAPLLRLVQN